MVINPHIIVMDSRNKGVFYAANLQAGDVVIDIGAYPGDVIEYCVEHKFEVYSFEPHPGLFKDIQKYGKNQNVHLYKAAAWKSDGVSRLYLKDRPDRADVGSSLIVEKTNVDKDSWIDVPTVDIGIFLCSFKEIGLLKIDAEGAEYYILERIKQFGFDNIKCIAMEDHSTKIASREWKEHKASVKDLPKMLPWY